MCASFCLRLPFASGWWFLITLHLFSFIDIWACSYLVLLLHLSVGFLERFFLFQWLLIVCVGVIHQ